MDITLLEKNSIKIKGKKVAIIIDPVSDMQKNSADAVILLSEKKADINKIDEARVLISGPGEYEVSRTKISGQKTSGGTVYSLIIDGIDVLVGKASDLSLMADKSQEHKIAIIMLDSEIKESLITSVEPKLAVLYGEKIDEAMKSLGKEKSDVEVTKKLTFKEDKLPEEMVVAVLS